MKNKTKLYFEQFGSIFIGELGFWFTAYFILLFTRFYRTLGVAADGSPVLLRTNIFAVLGTSLIFAIYIATINSLLERKIKRKILLRRDNMARIIIFRSLYNFFLAVLAVLLGVYGVKLVLFKFFPDIPEVFFSTTIAQVFRNMEILVILVFTAFASGFRNSYLMIKNKLGYRQFWDLMSGKYHIPQEENRIFLFIDLVSSTEIGEALGHKKYSNLLQDCYRDLTKIIVDNDADIYQFVGDEAVLTWDNLSEECHESSIHTYFDFIENIERKKDYYIDRYGLIPHFKAAVNCGSVMVAEVGLIKRELAYHGDVLNTAARVLKMNKTYHTNILVTEPFTLSQEDDSPFIFNFMGEPILRGKECSVKVYTVQRKVVVKNN